MPIPIRPWIQAPGDMSGTAIRTAIISSVANAFTSGIDDGNVSVSDFTDNPVSHFMLSGFLATAVPLVADAATARYAEDPGNIITDLLGAANAVNRAGEGATTAVTLAAAAATAAAAAAATPAASHENLDLD